VKLGSKKYRSKNLRQLSGVSKNRHKCAELGIFSIICRLLLSRYRQLRRFLIYITRLQMRAHHMTKFLVTMASTLAFASAAFAADMPTPQPPPPAPVVGKAPIPIIGKLPVVGKAPLGKNPPPPPPVVTKG
jgi:hypothetical protein